MDKETDLKRATEIRLAGRDLVRFQATVKPKGELPWKFKLN